MTILAIFAHPDDETGVGSSLAYYSDRGVRTVLLCATRGEAATIYCDDCATRENLAQVRTAELECACAHIGIHELRWLDWPDGGVKDLPREQAIGAIVRHIRDIRPHVILTHPEHGLYPHPDHLAIWEMVREAFTLAADEAAYPAAGPAWAPARLFTRALPQSLFEAAPGLKEFRVELNGDLLPFYGTPDTEIDVTMHVEPWVERRMAAWACHRSQHNPKGFSTVMPDGIRREMAAHEHYILAAARIPLPEGVKDDLLAGLEPETADHDAPVEMPLAALRVELARHRALAEICESYEQTQTDPRLHELYRQLAEGEHEAVYRLARAVRLAGEGTGDIAADADLRAEGLRRATVADRLAFLRTRLEEAAAHRRPWSGAADDLLALIEAQLALLAAFPAEEQGNG
ncbi:MAG: PIG-L family deacetylase [Anaerolineae bacterium]|nr:PIG-L family deacetylase [Anaerolineae bacterium]